MTVLCTYPLATSGAADLLDVARNHQFATARHSGRWEVIETPQLKHVRDETERRNASLERRDALRNDQLEVANEALRREIREHGQTEAELRGLKDDLAADLVAMNRLHEFSTRLLATTELQPMLDEVLNATIALQNADFGNVQLYDP